MMKKIIQRHPRDHVGIWFEQRRKLGISDTIIFGRYWPDTGTVTTQTFQHSTMDGVSCLAWALREITGQPCSDLPVSRENAPPSPQQLKQIKRQQGSYTKSLQWRYWNRDSKEQNATACTLFLDRQQTIRAEQYAKEAGVSLNTLLLWSLNKAVASRLLTPGQEYTWFYPVNLRGAVHHGTDYSNYSSGFYLPVSDNITLQDLHQRIRERLKAGEYWLSWHQAKISRWLPGFLIRYIYQLISKKQFYAGSFSTLGNWPTENTPADSKQDCLLPDERWFICAPGTANYPVSNAVLIWQGQLTLTLKLHPSITDNTDECEEILCEWGRYLTSEAMSSVAELLQSGKLLKTSL